MRACPTCGTQFVEGEQFCPFDATRLEDVAPIASVAPPIDPLLGQVLDGRYRIVRELGAGGMGKVYEAEHTTIRRPLAIKVLRDSEAANPEMVARFRQEAQSASRIGHENIVEVLDFGTTPNGASYMVMELLRGRDLLTAIAQDGPFSPERCFTALMQATTALEAAHRAGIVHRDLKSENLFLCAEPNGGEKIKIVDFGLAKMSDLERPGQPGQRLTKTGMIFGTPKYMSPEQCMGRPADARSDIYALGIIAYEMLTGRTPFDSNSFLGIINMHMFDPPPPMREANPNVAVPPALEHSVLLALSKDPSQRPQTMAEFADRLRAGMGQMPSGGRPRMDTAEALRLRISMRDIQRPPPRRFGPERFLVPILLLAIVAGVGWMLLAR